MRIQSLSVVLAAAALAVVPCNPAAAEGPGDAAWTTSVARRM